LLFEQAAQYKISKSKQGDIKKPPLISHKAAANRTDALKVLTA
jgi:hypothetical protein